MGCIGKVRKGGISGGKEKRGRDRSRGRGV